MNGTVSRTCTFDSVKRTRTILLVLALLGFLIMMVLAIVLPLLAGSRRRRIAEAEDAMAHFIAGVQQYRTEYGTLPARDSTNILKALFGDNPRKIPFLLVPSRSLNAKGEWLDPWGTPYEFRLSSTNSISVKSAGKNKIFGDKDDIVTERPLR